MKGVLLLLLLSTALLRQGCIVAEEEEELRESEQRSVLLGAGVGLAIQNFNGPVIVSGTPAASTVRLRFEKRAQGVDNLEARKHMRDIAIQEIPAGATKTHTVLVQSDTPRETSVEIYAEIPAGTTLRVESTSGAVEIDDVTGAVTVVASNGAVTVREVGGPLDVRARNGNVDADMAFYPLGNTVALHTANGYVTLRLPRTASARIAAQADIGEVLTSGLALSGETLTRSLTGVRLEATLGKGHGTVDLRTNNGVVRLEGR